MHNAEDIKKMKTRTNATSFCTAHYLFHHANYIVAMVLCLHITLERNPKMYLDICYHCDLF